MTLPRHTPVLSEGARLRSRVQAPPEFEFGEAQPKARRAHLREEGETKLDARASEEVRGTYMGIAGLIRTALLVGLGAIWLLA